MSRIAWCPDCHSPVVDLPEKWSAHRMRIHPVPKVEESALPSHLPAVTPMLDAAVEETAERSIPATLRSAPNHRIYSKAYYKCSKLRRARIINQEDTALVMVMLIALEVSFNIEATIRESRKPPKLVEQVYRNMQESKLWVDRGHGVKWGFEYGHEPDNEEDRQLLAVEFSLHVLVARGEVVRVEGSIGKEQR